MTAEQFMSAMVRYSKVQPFGAPDFSDKFVCEFWFDSLKGIPPETLGPAMRKLCSGKRFPCVDDVLNACGRVEQTDEEVARETVMRIKEAVQRFGYTNWDQAKAHIGPLGEHVVRSMGGWDSVCGYDDMESLDIALAQAREYTKVAVKKERAGLLGLPPSVPGGKTLGLITDLANSVDLNKPKLAANTGGQNRPPNLATSPQTAPNQKIGLPEPPKPQAP